MANVEWFRRTTWTAEDELAFFARLRKSRGTFHKSQYLRIQAHSLAETRSAPLVRVALDLLQRLIAEYPDRSQLEQAHLQAAQCHGALSNSSKAIEHFRLAQEAHAQYPNTHAGTALEFPWFIVENGLSSLYDEALDALQAAPDLVFPIQIFKAAAVRAIVAEHKRVNEEASRHASEALQAAGLKRSPFRYHQTLGLVGTKYEQIIKRLDRLAAA